MYGEPRDGEDPNVFYYLTLYNEPIVQPAQPADVDVDGILAGMHRYSPADDGRRAATRRSWPPASPCSGRLEAQRLLQRDWAVQRRRVVGDLVDASYAATRSPPTSGTSCTPAEPRRIPYVTSRLTDEPGPVVAVSDWMRAVPDQIAPFVPGTWSSLGTDGFGLSDTRGALRRHFGVDAPSIVLRVLEQLVERREARQVRAGAEPSSLPADEVTAAAPGNSEGSAE